MSRRRFVDQTLRASFAGYEGVPKTEATFKLTQCLDLEMTKRVQELRLTIPLVPPSVNHYKQRARSGHYFVTAEAKAFKHAIAIIAQGRSVSGKRYQVDVMVYLGKGQKGDCDNFWKVILDGLKEAGVVKSDSATHPLLIDKDRDPNNPRTEILVRAL